MWSWLRNQALRFWTAATLAFILYTIPTGIINYFAEMHFIPVSPGRWIWMHWFIGGFLRIVLSPVEAYLVVFLRNKYQAAEGTAKRGIIDATALALYQIPLYLLASRLGGRDWDQLRICLFLSLTEHTLFGFWHGRILDWSKAKFANGHAATPQPIKAAT
jgi:hypothetical protein